ncbi:MULTISPECIES: DUF2330 domain-containing protein [unclassified Streptomyces]|uniref:DUF2330 domain-containing protein n=1 Tax=unclassified Streptomyces TaxID=2593676 RepID=UPI0001C19CDE|nr:MULTISPECIES: DUF2330 domain-containing protein [unclassified Streptomyces]AEN09734.1 Protein of unknown function DUF2330 [Streptomyces sp. SirexAA-E]PZX44909.1 uncharacterized protein DUF2330 [Streptomyces sp. DvalAA-21]RAJ32569.1 uncharacterized protein DUF2330 [Streptomyces sp. DpondAA-E10]RAJ47530.1 uncharacterized protein DUF2330 [Streptomyces sp. DpondAA-A50]SCE02109.1 hypothetical protein GA0115235_11094 [Streptomyces sp. DpondAA-F4a]
MRGRGPGGTRCGRVLSLLLILAALQLGSLVAPAYACGCGAMVPSERSRIAVGQETSVVHWDGRTEQIVMRLTVRGDAREAAWIMPVPHRASVELGDAALFDELAEITAPVRETRHHFWPRDGDWPFAERDGAGAPAPGAAAPVGVVDRRRLGPFDVARLTATDPEALRTWLEGNGFALPGPLEAALRTYVDQGWEYVAVRLAPEEAGAVLTGALDPLRLRFASDRPVYPMRLSRLARTAQSLGLYVIAEHRMEPSGAIGGREPEVTFAGRLERTVPDGAVAGLVGDGPAFLTAFDQYFPDPSRIDGDHELRAAAADTPYRTVRHRDELLAVGGVPAWLLSVLAVLLLAVARALRAVRRRRARPPV